MVKQLYLTHRWDCHSRTVTLSQRRPEGNGTEGVSYIPESLKTGASPSDIV